MPSREETTFPFAAHWIRPLAVGLLVIFLLLSALLVWMGNQLLFNYGQLWRQALIVETGRWQKLSATPDLSGTVLPHVL